MTRKTSHWRDISKQQLQWMLALLKDAAGPMTQGDVRRELVRRGLADAVEAIPTVIWEIGQNPGHQTSGGVRFPDGKYRYWLTQAPGWTPRWIVRDFDVVPYEQGQAIFTAENAEPAEEVTVQNDPPAPRLCRHCDADLPAGSGPFCGDECEEAYWAYLTGKATR